MRIESHDEVLLAEAELAFERAKGDVLEEAVRLASRYSRTGKFADSLVVTRTSDVAGRLVARVGSPLISAHAKEVGAYITAKAGPYLTFRVGGQWVKVPAVRLPRRPAVVPAGRQFPVHMTERLRELRK